MKLSLNQKKQFVTPLAEEKMSKVCEDYTPANTAKNTTWALRVFTECDNERDGLECPKELLEKPSADQLNYWLSRFVVEVRRVDGSPYPSSTVYQLLLGTVNLWYMRSKCRDCPNFWNKSDAQFKELHGAE